MLVYTSNPLGEITLHNYIIYGYERGKPPTDIPYEMYTKYISNRKNSLIQDATYREHYFQVKLNKYIEDEFAFKFSELNLLPYDRILNLIKLLSGRGVTGITKRVAVKKLKMIIAKFSPKINVPFDCAYCKKKFFRHFSSTLFCSKGCRKRATTKQDC